MVRFEGKQLAAIDAWIKYQPEKISRPEAIRQLAEKGLKGSDEPRQCAYTDVGSGLDLGDQSVGEAR